ncbi:MAG: hypothetical protein ACTSW1_02430, partial [Candidatus Hodarchaeales archaeon]
MIRKYHKYVGLGFLSLLMLLGFSTTITAHSSDNRLYPYYNFFAFNEKGQIRSGLSNRTVINEDGLSAYQISSNTEGYKFRFILAKPEYRFEYLELRVKLIYTPEYTNIIRWGFLRNITVNIYPFDLAMIEGINKSVQVVNALDLLHGSTIRFDLNSSAFTDVNFMELSLSTWNATESILGVELEKMAFELDPVNLFSSSNVLFLFIFSCFSLFSIIFSRSNHHFLSLLILVALVIVPLAVITQTKGIVDLIEDKEEGVSRFVFFNALYERRDLGNGYFSLRMIKDYSKAFETQAYSGTGAFVVYPVIVSDKIDESLQLLESSPTQRDLNPGGSDPKFPSNKTSDHIANLPRFSFDDISGSPDWWNASYSYVRQVTIKANSALGTNYTVQLKLDTASLVSASKMFSNCSDLRIVYYNGVSWTELDRAILHNNTAQTSIFFRLQQAISASANDTNYAIYYGFKSGKMAAPKENLSNIFIDSDDFTAGNLNAYSSKTGWTASTDSTKPTNIGWWTNTDIAADGQSNWNDLVRSNLITNNTQVLVLLRTNSLTSESSINLRSTTGSDYVYLSHSTSNLALKRYNGSTYTFTSSSGGYSSSTWYLYKFQIVGNVLKGKNWLAIKQEPVTWNISSTQYGLPTSGSLIFVGSNTGTYIGMWAVSAAVSTEPTVTIDSEQKEIVKITTITISNHKYSNGTHYWEDNDGVGDSLTITVTAVWNVTGKTYQGEVYINHSGSTTALGSTTSLSLTLEEDPTVGNIITYYNITVGAAILGPNNQIGTEVYIDPSVSSYNIGWDNEAPTITHSSSNTNESSQYLYYDGSSKNGYYSNNMGLAAVSFNVGGLSSDSGAGLFSITDNTNFGGNPGRSGSLEKWSFGYSIDQNNASYGTFTITYTATDQVGNSATDTFQFIYDGTSPTLSDVMSAYAKTGDTDEVYGDVGTNVLYFSNSFDTSATVTFTADGTDGESGVRGVDFGVFGADNPVEDVSSPYTGSYVIDNVDITGTITVTIYDNVGNSASGTITCTEDADAPTISVTGESESSTYLYAEYGTDIEGVYGSGMGSVQSFTITGTASDSGSGLLSLDDDTAFGGGPSNTGNLSNWEFVYQITATDNGDVVVTYTVIDNVGNSNTATYTFYEDNTDPILLDAMSGYSDTGDTDEVYGVISSNTFYFSDSFDSPATVTFTANGSDSDSGVRGIDFGAFGGDDPTEDTVSPYTGSYTINGTDASGIIAVTIYDNVGNSASGTITCTEDSVSPSIGVTGESESSTYLYAEYGTGIEGVYGSGMGSVQSFTITGTASDSGSGLLSLDDDTAFGGDPSNSGTLSSWEF